jgi:hypothetical protein
MVKLLKYELGVTARVFLPLYGVLLAFCFFSGIAAPLAISQPGVIFSGVRFAVFFALAVAISVLTLVLTVQRFYENLLGCEGYLMFTLPVSSHSLILSKLLTASCWLILSGLAVGLGSLLMIGGQLSHLREVLEYGLGPINPLFLDNLWLYLIEWLAQTLSSTLRYVLMIYASISVGHLMNRNRASVSFMAFVGFFALQSSLRSLSLLVLDYLGAAAPIYSLLGIGGGLALGAVYYLITHWVLTHRLNLE